MALVGSNGIVKQVFIGHGSEPATLAAVERRFGGGTCETNWCPSLVRRLKEYAAGKRVEFADVEIDLSELTSFQRRVVKHCRAIVYGDTRSYGELARLSGSPRAARAVGTTMAINHFALIVPCHRVVKSGGGLGGFSAPQGPQMKARLLAMERREPVARLAKRPATRPRKAAC
jgi:O-6-methylguanine DNA methyltransferase